MSEGAHVAVVAVIDLVRVALAELGFVLLGVIEVFDPVVGPDANVTILTVAFAARDITAKLRRVMGGYAASITLVRIVVVQALLAVVRLRDLARDRLEGHQVQEDNTIGWGRKILHPWVVHYLAVAAS